jgi:hypothetical protein
MPKVYIDLWQADHVTEEIDEVGQWLDDGGAGVNS